MKVKDISMLLEEIAPLNLQESYDNAGLLTGNYDQVVTKILVTLDTTEDVIDEAINKGCNLIVAHHPIIFGGIKKLNGKNYVERTVIKAIKNDIAIYAIHTNLDNVYNGVNRKICDKIGLKNLKILAPVQGSLKKLSVYVPLEFTSIVKQALFKAGCGHIGNYDECSFTIEGTGTYRANEDAKPFLGKIGEQHHERETKIETIFPAHLQQIVLNTLASVHPYEEIAYDIFALNNVNTKVGSGMIGELEKPVKPMDFLKHLKQTMNLNTIRFTQVSKNEIHKIAVCGGAGSFLIKNAIASGADAFVTADVKYHEFFDAENQLMIADIGHYESEIFTKELLMEVIIEKIPTFAVLLSETITNPINYYNS